jgi:hypothetical protein
MLREEGRVTVTVTRGTIEVATVTVTYAGEPEPARLAVETEPPLDTFQSEVQEAVVSALSLSMQPLVEVESLD